MNTEIFIGFLAGPTGLEPATSAVTVQRSNQAELRPHDTDYMLSVKGKFINKRKKLCAFIVFLANFCDGTYTAIFNTV